MRLKDKVIFITGGQGLIGREVAKQVVAEGGQCIIADLNLDTDLEKGIVRCDVTDTTSVTSALALVIEKYGRIDGLVNSAYPRTADWGVRFDAIPFASWQANVDMQMNSIFFICQQVLAQMKGQRFGSVVNIASIYGIVGPDFSVYEGTEITMPAAYAAIKGGIINFTRYLASYYGPDAVRINCVSPGGVFDNQNAVFVKNYDNKVPLRRMARPAELAAPVCFLLSEESSYITGHNLVVDGGWTAI